jgi:hypothetical protein
MENVWRLSTPEQNCGLRGRIEARNGDEREKLVYNSIICKAWYKNNFYRILHIRLHINLTLQRK